MRDEAVNCTYCRAISVILYKTFVVPDTMNKSVWVESQYVRAVYADL